MFDLPSIPPDLARCPELGPILYVCQGKRPDDPRKGAYMGTLARNLACAKLLDPALAAFADAAIPYQPLKGALFVELLYGGDPGVRPMSDVDLLIPEGHLDSAHACLERLGFEQLGVGRARFAPRFTHHNIYRRAPLLIELHFQLWHEIALDPDPRPFFEQQMEISFRGRPLAVARPELQMYQVLLHAATHGFMHTPVWIIDALRLEAQYRLDWRWIETFAKKNRAARALAAASRLIHRYFPGALPLLPARGWRDHALDRLLAQTPMPSQAPARSLLVRGLLTDRSRDAVKLLGDKALLRTLELLRLDAPTETL